MNDLRPPEYLYWNQLLAHIGSADKIFSGEFIWPRQMEIHLPADHKRACNLACPHCHAAGTPILMADLTWKPIEQIKEGEYIIGCNSLNEKGLHWKYGLTKVIWAGNRIASTIRLITDRGTTECTPDHKWLRKDGRYDEATKRHSRTIKWLSYPTYFIENEEYKIGWINGISRGDGCLRNHTYKRIRRGKVYFEKSRSFKLALQDNEPLKRIQYYLPGIDFRYGQMMGSKTMLNYVAVYKQIQVDVIEKIISEFTYSIDYLRGFLGGIFDAEGSYSCGTISITNTNPQIIADIKHSLAILGFKFKDRTECHPNKKQRTSFRFSRMQDIIRFFAITNPSINRKRAAFYGMSIRGEAKILGTAKGRITTVYNIQTETGNYVANGMISKNCAGKLFDKSLARWEPVALRLLDKVAGAIPYHIYGGAYTEPALNPYYLAFLAKTKEYGNHFGMHVNGTCLKWLEENQGWLTELNRLSTDRTDYLSISIDAGTPESWAKTKGTKHADWFYDIMEASRLAVGARVDGRETHAIRWCYLISKYSGTEADFESIVRLARDIGVDSLRFSIPFANYNQDFARVRKYKYDTEQPLDVVYRRMLEPYLSLNQNDKPYIFYVEPAFTWIDNFTFAKCVYSYFQITIGADGYIYRCSTTATPMASHCRLGKLTDDVEQFKSMIFQAQKPDWNPQSECFRKGLRCNRMGIECSLNYEQISKKIN